VPDENSPTYNNYGSGPQINHSGGGTQNNNTSHGNMYVANNMNIGKN